MRGRIQPHSASGRGTSRHQLWRVGVRVSAGRTRHIGHRPKFHLRLFFGRRHLNAEGNGLSASGATNLDVPFAGHGEIPWARAQSLYASRDCGATTLGAVPSRSVPRTIRRSAISTTCFRNILESEPNHLQNDTVGRRDQWLEIMECRDT